ncbi:uncharacterized protein LOC127243303 [Andrographis paniculata]|uniref:uncharacterized protein LOC127243303 n=1 Tax=Andrographis paniculata TaxID=175694 RepID=UPI0021E7EAA4|nr:uncharacterized protein LOC127243303 [Andrographis paniculata]
MRMCICIEEAEKVNRQNLGLQVILISAHHHVGKTNSCVESHTRWGSRSLRQNWRSNESCRRSKDWRCSSGHDSSSNSNSCCFRIQTRSNCLYMLYTWLDMCTERQKRYFI